MDHTTSASVCCSLCGGQCAFDGRDGWTVAGGLAAILGWYLLPTAFAALGHWLFGFDEGAALGLGAWVVLLVLCFSRPSRWICSQCGAYFFARRRRPANRPQRPD